MEPVTICLDSERVRSRDKHHTCGSAHQGRCQSLADNRYSVAHSLVQLASCKVSDLKPREWSKHRGGGRLTETGQTGSSEKSGSGWVGLLAGATRVGG